MPQDSMASTDAVRLRAVAAADDAFGAAVYQSLGAGAQNTVFSPASIAAALQMALCGARGKTAAQMADGPAPRRARTPPPTGCGC